VVGSTVTKEAGGIKGGGEVEGRGRAGEGGREEVDVDNGRRGPVGHNGGELL